VYQGYDREDGLWDIEAELTDVKTFSFQVPNERLFPGNAPIHGLKIRVSLVRFQSRPPDAPHSFARGCGVFFCAERVSLPASYAVETLPTRCCGLAL
jgi:hypothetical protein